MNEPENLKPPAKSNFRRYLQWILAPVLTAISGLILYYQGPWYGVATLYAALISTLLGLTDNGQFIRLPGHI